MDWVPFCLFVCLLVYIELTPGAVEEQVTLQFRLEESILAALRRWDIKVTQVECNSVSR